MGQNRPRATLRDPPRRPLLLTVGLAYTTFICSKYLGFGQKSAVVGNWAHQGRYSDCCDHPQALIRPPSLKDEEGRGVLSKQTSLLSPPQTPHSFSDVRCLTTPTLGQLIAHPINGCLTKSTARLSSLRQVWLVSVLATWLIPTGHGPLPGVIQTFFAP